MDYFFEKTSIIITEDDVHLRVGLNNTAPQYSLDVNSDIRATALLTSNAVVAQQTKTTDLVASNVDAVDIIGSNVGALMVVADDVYGSNIDAAHFLQGLTINAESNLCWGGHSLNLPYPQDQSDWDELIPFDPDMEGMIHSSWLYKPLSAKDILTDLYNLAEMGIDIGEAIYDLYQMTQGNIESLAMDAIQKALEAAGEEGASNQLLVAWANLKGKPIGNSGTTIGIKGDLLLNEAQSIKRIPAGNYTTDAYGNVNVATTGSETILNVGTKELFVESVDVGSNVRLATNVVNLFNSNIVFSGNSNDFVKINDWVLSQGIISNCNNNLSAIQFNSNNTLGISGPVNLTHKLTVYDTVGCDRYIAGNGELYFQASNLKSKFTYFPNSNSLSGQTSYLYQWGDTLEYKTQESQSNYGGVAPQVLQFSVDSNGSLYVRSNIAMTDTAILKATKTADLDNPYREGILRLTHDTLRWVNSSNTGSNMSEKILWSVNSNGMFLNEKYKILGKVETGASNFPRLEASLCNGLIWGKGIGGDINSTDLIKMTEKAEIYTFNHSNQMLQMLVNSNAELTRGTLSMDYEGNLKTNGSNVITAGGSIIRRVNPDDPTGLLISPSGYARWGGTTIDPYGVIDTTCNMSFKGETWVSSNIRFKGNALQAYSHSNGQTYDFMKFATNSNPLHLRTSMYGDFKTGINNHGFCVNSFVIADGFHLAPTGNANTWYNYYYTSNWAKNVSANGGYSIQGLSNGTLRFMVGKSNDTFPNARMSLGPDGHFCVGGFNEIPLMTHTGTPWGTLCNTQFSVSNGVSYFSGGLYAVNSYMSNATISNMVMKDCVATKITCGNIYYGSGQLSTLFAPSNLPFVLYESNSIKLGDFSLNSNGIFYKNSMVINSRGKIPSSCIDYGDGAEVAVETVQAPTNVYPDFTFDL